MKERLLMYLRIFFVAGGIILRTYTDFYVVASILIGLGVLSKVIQIILKIKSGEYKPGQEVIFLFTGLALFFSGLYLRTEAFEGFNPTYLIFTGIALKITFIILVIIKIRKKSHV